MVEDILSLGLIEMINESSLPFESLQRIYLDLIMYGGNSAFDSYFMQYIL